MTMLDKPIVKASPAAKKLAEQLGVDLSLAVGSGPAGRVTEKDVQLLAEKLKAGRPAASGALKATPAAKRLAKELNINLSEVVGTGPEGRITESDVQAAAACLASVVPKIRITPLALKIAQDYGIAIANLEGSGTGGKITKADVRLAAGVSEKLTDGSSDASPSARTEPLTDSAYEVVPYAGMRKVIGERMWQSVQTAPHFTLTTEVNVEGLVKFRSVLNGELTAQGQAGVSYTDILVKVAAVALKRYPNVNAVLVDGQIRRMNEVNVGVATALSNGLIVPVVRQADQKSIPQISQEVRGLISRAREGKSVASDISGGSFTISNLGMYDIDAFTPIINQPESAILGVGRMIERPVADNGTVVIKPTMLLSLSVDHRVIDGAPGALFLKEIKSMLQDPYLLLLRI